MSLESAYQDWIKRETEKASGERRDRLSKGLEYASQLFAQQVWWPAVGHFDDLHPEWEVHDFKDGVRFLDFASLRSPVKVDIEVDGFGAHQRDVTRWQFSDNLHRQNHLVMDGWLVIRFAYDDIRERPRRCQQTIQQLRGRWFGYEHMPVGLSFKDKEIIRLAVHHGLLIRPADVAERLGVSSRYARELLRDLMDRGYLVPASGEKRVRAYRLNPVGPNLFL